MMCKTESETKQEVTPKQEENPYLVLFYHCSG